MPGQGGSVRRGLVLGGGGALGAYQGGALKAIWEHGIRFEILSATSIGTLHALAWNIDDLILHIDRHWLDNATALRPFDSSQLMRGKNPFRFRTALDQLFDAYRDSYPEDDQAVTEILVALTEYETSRLRVFSTHDTRYTREERELLQKASTVLPHLGMKPIAIGDRHYFDGGFLNNLPIHPLAGRGLDEIWLIPLFPLIQATAWSRALGLHYPLLSRLTSNPYVGSILGLVDQVIQPVDLALISERTVLVAPGGFWRSVLLFQPVRALTFSTRNIRKLLARGYRDGTAVCQRYLARSG